MFVVRDWQEGSGCLTDGGPERFCDAKEEESKKDGMAHVYTKAGERDVEEE